MLPTLGEVNSGPVEAVEQPKNAVLIHFGDS